MSSADVSVVVPSFRQGPFLQRCLASIRAQHGVNVELVVIDACSDDETGDVLDRWRDAIDRLVVEPDDGQADAIAKGFTQTTAPLITWLNADDAYAGPDALSTLARWLNRREDIDLVYGRRAWVDASGALMRLDRWQPFSEPAFRVACYLPQECALFRRAAYDRAGGVDPAMQFALDYDLWLRMLDSGSRFLAVAPVVGLFRVHAEQKTTDHWSDVGLPEIRALHARSGVTGVTEAIMLETAEDHRAGAAATSPAARRLHRDVSDILNGHLVTLLEGRPLDRWYEDA